MHAKPSLALPLLSNIIPGTTPTKVTPTHLNLNPYILMALIMTNIIFDFDSNFA